jgi:hypothetical protein
VNPFQPGERKRQKGRESVGVKPLELEIVQLPLTYYAALTTLSTLS